MLYFKQILTSDQSYFMVKLKPSKKIGLWFNSCDNNENEHIPFWELKENIELYWTFAVSSQTQSNKTCTHVSGKAVTVLFWAENEYMLTVVSLL